MPAGLDQRSAGGDRTGRIGDVFEHFHAGNDIVAAALLNSQFFSRRPCGSQPSTAFQQVQAGNAQRLVGKIDTGDRRTSLAHPFGKQATAATDVKHALAGQLALTVDPVQAQGLMSCNGLKSLPGSHQRCASWLNFSSSLWSALIILGCAIRNNGQTVFGIRPAVQPATKDRIDFADHCRQARAGRNSSSAISGAWSEQRAQAMPFGTCMSSTWKPRT
jgi:hypothetical protein